MQKKFLYFKFFFTTFLPVIFCFGKLEAQIDIKINILPPYHSKVTDYASHPQQVLLLVHNASNLSFDVQLRGTITGDNGIVLRVDPQYRSPSPIHLNPGEIKNLNASDISQLFDYDELLYSGISKNDVIRSNGLPEGNYQVCVQAYDYNTNKLLSSQEPLGCSNIFSISNVEPPIIISPFNEQAINSQTTQNFIIAWTTPAGSPPSTQYTVSMVPIFDNRNPNDAMNSAASPLFFQQTVIGTNLLMYGPSMPTLTPGRRYALIVVAKDPFNTVTFRNGGKSEVIGFIYGDTTAAAASGNSGSTSSGGNAGNIPTYSIKGKLTWYYRQSEERNLFAKVKYDADKMKPSYNINATDKMIINAALTDPTFVAAVQPAAASLGTGSPAKRINTLININALKAAEPTAPVVPSSSKQLMALAPAGINSIISGSSYTPPTNTANFNNYGSEQHVLPNETIKLYAVDSTQPYATPVFAGSATTDEEGNFQLSFVPPATFGDYHSYKYLIRVQDNYFTLPGFSFAIPANSNDYDLGELKALANTYRFVPFALNESDSEIISASIGIYRRTDFYSNHPSLKTEGNMDENNRPDTIIDGQHYNRITSIDDGYAGTRLFFSNGDDDEYKIVIYADRFSNYSAHLAIPLVVPDPKTPELIYQSYKLVNKPTSLSGQVSTVLGDKGVKQGIAGATVTLYLTDDAYNKAVNSSKTHIMVIPISSSIQTISNNNTTTSNQTGQVTVKANAALKKNQVSAMSTVANSGSNNNSAIPTAKTLITNIQNNITSISDHITVTTDSNGYYTISYIPLSNSTRKIVAEVPGTVLTQTKDVQQVFPGAQLPDIDFTFTYKTYSVTGRAVDEKQNGISRASYFWASGGDESQTDSSGYFLTTHKAGQDTLIIKKLGYEIKRIPVNITGELLEAVSDTLSQPTTKVVKFVSIPSGNNSNNNSKEAKFYGSLQNTPTYKQAAQQGTPITPQGFGFYSSNTGTAASSFVKSSLMNSMLGANDDPSGSGDLGSIVLKKQIGRMLISVRDETNKPVANANIQIEGSDSAGWLTDENGNRYIEGPSGDLTLDVYGPTGSSYAPGQVSITVSESDTTKHTVQLVQGAVLTGHVRSSGAVIDNADISVEGIDYIHAVSDKSGAYTLTIPKNTEYTIKASKQGYISDSKSQEFTGNATVDFALTTAGFNISTLLGLPVEIDKIENETNGNKKLTGSFVNLPGNSVFSARSGVKIPFTGVEVSIQNNVPVPVNAIISTDITELSLKAFNFLPVKLNNAGNPIIIRETNTDGSSGQVEGLAEIDYGSFMPSGVEPYIDDAAKQYLENSSSSSAQAIPVISSTAINSKSLSLFGTSENFNLYGFNATLDLPHTVVKADGMHFKGTISFNDIPLVSNTSLQIQDLWIGTNGYVSNVSVNMNPAPTFKIATWNATLTGLSFSDNGFSVSGNVQVQVPSSQVSSVDFANLNISTDQLYGGSFTIPASGIDVFGIVKFIGGSTPLSFGKLGSSNVYYIGGSGAIKFPSLFDDITMKFFQVQTNGQFNATVQTNINEDFYGIAKVQVTDIGFHTTNGVGVDVNGNFLLSAIPWLKASVGGVHFGSNGSVSVDNIGLEFDLVGVANVKASVVFVDQPNKKGFSGDGSITIIGLPGAEIGFGYFKVPNGISVSANFKANIVIPLGAIVSINNPGGGFTLNTADHSWSVNINGNVSATGLGTAVNMSISVTVSSGPVISGTAGLNVLTINVANANFNMDVPKSLLTVTINADVSLIPKVISTDGSAIFTLSWKKDDSYFMVAAQYQSSLLGIFNDRINIAAGWGLNVPNHPEYAEYTSFIDPDFLENETVLKGISLSATSNIAFKATGDIYIASGSIWYKNNGTAKINMGFGAGNYGLSVSASWDCGASISVSPFGEIAGVDIGTDAGIYLNYSNGCFSAGGDLAAHLSASIGDCDDGCFTGICTDYDIPSGGKICVHPGLRIGYDCDSGFSFGIDLF